MTRITTRRFGENEERQLESCDCFGRTFLGSKCSRAERNRDSERTFCVWCELQDIASGHYEIQRVRNQQIADAILVRNIDNPQYRAITLGYEGSWETTPFYKADTERMVFDNYDGKYFLHEVRGPAYSLNFEFPVTEVEKTARKLALNATETTIVAGE